jgi:putative nucleotidyltransferase-like protein
VEAADERRAESYTALSVITTRPENEVLICAARRSLSGDVAARMTALVEGELDWKYLRDKATQHGMLPLLYRHLNSVCGQAVPDGILDSMKEEFIANSQTCLHLFGELRKLLRLFDQNGIAAVAFKGPILSAAVYGDIALRQAGDLDILVETRAFRAARDLLSFAGYRLHPPLTESQLASQLRSHCEIEFWSNGLSVVDLHWGLSPKAFHFALDPKDIIDRSKTISIQGTSLRTFSNEDTILYLCFHGAKHYWSRLEWISSLAEFIRSSQDIDWSIVIARAKGARARRMLTIGLILARELGDVDLPDSVLSSSEEFDALRKYAAEIQRGLFAREPGPLGTLKMFRCNLRIMDRKRDAITSFLRSIFVPTISDWEALTLPAALSPLYYLFRPLRLLKKYGASSFGSMSSRHALSG